MGNSVHKIEEKVKEKVEEKERPLSELIKIFNPVFTLDGTTLYVKTAIYLETIELTDIVSIHVKNTGYYSHVEIKEVKDQDDKEVIKFVSLLCSISDKITRDESLEIAYYLKEKVCEYFENYIKDR